MNVNIEDLSEVMADVLERWEQEVKHTVNDAARETAKTAVKSLKQGGPYRERTGEYTKGWTYGQRKDRTSVITGVERYAVYNRKHYQLTHLLEKGHTHRYGGRVYPDVRAYAHIAPVNDMIGELIEGKIKRKVEALR